ncbi:MAG: hypothetical protein NVSMB5_02290 [Candidatus Velthaea sp.]
MTLREANGLGFMHRERARFHAGTSDLLGLELVPQAGEGVIIDVTAVEELHTVRSAPGGMTVGAFTALRDVALLLPEYVPLEGTPAMLRLRLSLLDAKVTIAGLGRSRVTSIDSLVLAPHELPTHIEIPAVRPGIGFADRRRVTTDGAASFTLDVSAALRISALGRFENVRIVIEFDGTVARAMQAEQKLEKQPIDAGRFAEAGRLAANAISALDARSSAAARAVSPLVVSALRDALEKAR